MTSLLGFIPARSGSVRVPDKNLRPLAGKSLIERTIDTARTARSLDDIAFSSDSAAYIEHAQAQGLTVEYQRPAAFARPDTTTAACVTDYLHWLEDQDAQSFPHIVLLQPTSPFRPAADIDAAIDLWRQSGRESLTSVRPAASEPRFLIFRDNTSERLTRHDDSERSAFVLDGAIFITPIAMIVNKGQFWDEESALFINAYPSPYDIDTENDFAAAEALLAD